MIIKPFYSIIYSLISHLFLYFYSLFYIFNCYDLKTCLKDFFDSLDREIVKVNLVFYFLYKFLLVELLNLLIFEFPLNRFVFIKRMNYFRHLKFN